MKVKKKIDFIDCSRHGFTLLEIMLATVIFSIVITALYTSFTVGMRAYTASDEKSLLLQESRFAFQMLNRDLQSVYYLPETSYNQTIRKQMDRLTPLQQEAQDLGISFEEYLTRLREENPDRLRDLGMEGSDDYDDDDDPLDPYNWGIPIDLKFIGKNSGEKDEVEFVRYQYADGIVRNEPWALERVRYFVKDKLLMRESEKVFMYPQIVKDSEATPTPVPPVEIIAEGVEQFNIFYGYYYDELWQETESWNSEERKHRNPMQELDPEEPDYSEKLRRETMKPVDGLPAYLFIKLRLKDPKGGKRKMDFQTTISLMAAQENYIPIEDEEDEDSASSDRRMRDFTEGDNK